MANPRLPDSVHIARGTFRADRHGDPAAKPKPLGEIGNPPDHMTEDQRAAWGDIIQQAPAGVLTGSDRLSVEIAAVLLAEFRADPVEFKAARLARLESLLSKFGMNPSDRAKIEIPALQKRRPWEIDPADQYFNQ